MALHRPLSSINHEDQGSKQPRAEALAAKGTRMTDAERRERDAFVPNDGVARTALARDARRNGRGLRKASAEAHVVHAKGRSQAAQTACINATSSQTRSALRSTCGASTWRLTMKERLAA